MLFGHIQGLEIKATYTDNTASKLHIQLDLCLPKGIPLVIRSIATVLGHDMTLDRTQHICGRIILVWAWPASQN